MVSGKVDTDAVHQENAWTAKQIVEAGMVSSADVEADLTAVLEEEGGSCEKARG